VPTRASGLPIAQRKRWAAVRAKSQKGIVGSELEALRDGGALAEWPRSARLSEGRHYQHARLGHSSMGPTDALATHARLLHSAVRHWVQAPVLACLPRSGAPTSSSRYAVRMRPESRVSRPACNPYFEWFTCASASSKSS